MAALVESLFYVSNEQNERFVPWHGLGREVQEAPTSKDAIVMAGLDWNVDQRPIYDVFGKEIPKFKANTRDTDNSVLGIVTDKYQVVQNSEAFEFTDALLDEGVTYETAGSLKDGRTIWLLAKMPQQKILDDAFDPYLCFMNTHDGTGSIKVCSTPIRVVCNNTLNLALSTAKRSWATKHMGDMQGKMQEAKITLGLANKYMIALSEEAEKLATMKISDEELEAIFDTMFPIDEQNDTQRKIENIKSMKANLFRCYAMPDISQYRGTVWGVINAATDMAAHIAPNRLTQKYQENNWGRIITGHPFVDALYDKLAA